MEVEYVRVGIYSLTIALICMKWALDLGYTQSRQILWGILGAFFNVLALFFLYTRLIRKKG